MRDPRLAPFRAPALAFAALLLVSAASGAVLFVLKLGTTAARVQEFYLGSEARFTAPRTLGGILEVAVPHLVAVPLVLFAVAHLVAFTRALRPRPYAALVRLSFGCALAGALAGLGIRFVAPWLAWVKIGAFVGLEAALLAWAALLVGLFLPDRAEAHARRAAAADGASPQRVPGAPRRD
ncbi:hypothetical protein [Anaeromyxobacter dehalogenans]|uniref:Uncharacterized protein n=1 Tax=Anaeromyxobacter dehalogenans (strain 2CP-C) TaxID=290397 RepID=Q2II65_ANADE|nr:hypothetical protein [Anaeromyxobacter dehalogenans]ABC81343.1 conserved hypothetical protein [Anaeromyxobacter dehalogenans 2CP-C]